MKKLSKIIGTIGVLIFVLLALSYTEKVNASGSHNLSGYAWSSNIGWISFNCSNDSSCGTSDYGVNVNSDDTLTGYAWSPNIGWIQFGGLSDFPTGGGTQHEDATMHGNNLKGWARALSYGDDWDGWISLSGAGYGVNMSGNSFQGYAWGSDVIGWLSFDVAGTNGVKQVGSATLAITNGGSSIVNTNVEYGTVPTFTWTIADLPSGTTCAVSKTSSGGTAFTTQSSITSNGSVQGSALTNGSYTYKIECIKDSAVTISTSYSFTVLPQPSGFSLGATETARVQFLNDGPADSEEKTIFVSPSGSFVNTVTIRVVGVSPAPTGTTTFTYSLGGSAFSANPSAVQILSPYTAGTTLKIRISKKVTDPYTVTLSGTASGSSDVTKLILVNPVSSTPGFEEF